MTRPIQPIAAMFVAAIVCLACVADVSAQTGVDTTVTRPDVEARIPRLFDAERFEDAASLLETYLDDHPHDADMLYNLACAYARLQRADDAAATLLRAVEAGFVAFDHMTSDPDLDSIRSHATYEAIVEAVRRVRDRGATPGASATTALDRWRARFGTRQYRYEIDDERKLAYATALADESHAQMREMIEREADHLAESLFDGYLNVPVLVAVPTPKHADQLLQAEEIGGMYVHASRQLIARNIGDSLRHEFVHAMHFAHMERLGQKHPLWIQEGIASLYESYTLSASGAITFHPNERHNIAKRRQRAGRLMDWDDLFELSSVRFMQIAGRMYPEVRSIFEFVAAEGKLEAWYDAYIEHFDDDPTGRTAFELTFDQPLEAVERSWHRWLADRDQIDTDVRTGDASLGIRAAENNANDGVLIGEVLNESGARRAGLRRGDVIVSIDTRPVRSLRDLQITLASFDVGDRVDVRVRRRGTYRTVTVQLRPRRAGT
ncbi:MAG: PDZ domain-containing protein [Planctomycetota bacterium]